MSAAVFMKDDDFDALVGALEALIDDDRAAGVGRWQIRLTLGGYGVLPASIMSGPELEDGLVATLRAVCGRRPAKLAAA